MGSPLSIAAAIITAVAALGAVAAFVILRRRRTPEERERIRRLAVNERGRLIDGLIREVRGKEVYYSYSWRGIDYDTSQDLTALSELLPEETHSLIGAVTVKFHPDNPYNSIVLCEGWSGFPKNKLRRGPAILR